MTRNNYLISHIQFNLFRETIGQAVVWPLVMKLAKWVMETQWIGFPNVFVNFDTDSLWNVFSEISRNKYLSTIHYVDLMKALRQERFVQTHDKFDNQAAFHFTLSQFTCHDHQRKLKNKLVLLLKRLKCQHLHLFLLFSFSFYVPLSIIPQCSLRWP